ncbi:unnamed protein product [Candidula unifasciata]|uniref:Mannosyltransferase n=1 Tax=Candidula unifasciata TaxID=100452 RepID=A0A8S3YZT7_9EUPU|nr:unnamed protein product [Candidula unifasciata]
MTWEWREGLRGYSYPLVFAVFYKVLSLLGLDSRILLIKIPRLVQAVIAAWGDLCLYKLSSKLSGRATAQWTLLCHLLSWFTIYCCTRTLTNSTETVLITAALSYFPWPDHPSKPKDIYKFLALAALSVVVRPTAALVWILLCSWHLQRVYGSAAFNGTVNAYLLIGSLSFGASAVVDRIWYGRWVFVQLNFLWFNLITGGADIYGVHPWHWYFVQGFPVVLGTLIFPFVVGAWRAKNKMLLWIILWILATHSFLAHKEFRFLMPIIPLACHYCGVYFQTLCCKPPVRKFRSLKKEDKKLKAKLSVIILLVTNLIPALYFCLLHQRGTVMVTKFIYDTSLKKPDSDVLFLMPCHSTPYYSYIHNNISMRFLTCEPNLMGVSNYTDEADLFYQDPKGWLRKEYMHAGQSWPAILVYFDVLQKDISDILLQAGYHPCESFFHTHIPEGRIGSYVLVSCR